MTASCLWILFPNLNLYPGCPTREKKRKDLGMEHWLVWLTMETRGAAQGGVREGEFPK